MENTFAHLAHCTSYDHVPTHSNKQYSSAERSPVKHPQVRAVSAHQHTARLSSSITTCFLALVYSALKISSETYCTIFHVSFEHIVQFNCTVRYCESVTRFHLLTVIYPRTWRGHCCFESLQIHSGASHESNLQLLL
jgi:hypothetical protein